MTKIIFQQLGPDGPKAHVVEWEAVPRKGELVSVLLRGYQLEGRVDGLFWDQAGNVTVHLERVRGGTDTLTDEQTGRLLAEVEALDRLPRPCPFCGGIPIVAPEKPEDEGGAWGRVECVNIMCPAQPRVGDGVGFSDDRGSEQYKAAAIARWNRWGTTMDDLSLDLSRAEIAEALAVCDENGDGLDYHNSFLARALRQLRQVIIERDEAREASAADMLDSATAQRKLEEARADLDRMLEAVQKAAGTSGFGGDSGDPVDVAVAAVRDALNEVTEERDAARDALRGTAPVTLADGSPCWCLPGAATGKDHIQSCLDKRVACGISETPLPN